MWLRVATDNLATGNWHKGGEVGGWWTAYLNNRIEADHPVTGDAWPADAVAVMATAGIEPGAGDISYREVRTRTNPHAKRKNDNSTASSEICPREPPRAGEPGHSAYPPRTRCARLYSAPPDRRAPF